VSAGDGGGRGLRLTADRGNSRLKLVLWRDDRVVARQVLEAEDFSPAGAVTEWMAALRADGTVTEAFPSLRGAAVSSVLRADETDAVRGMLESALHVEVLLHPDCGLVNACRTPETVGHDRLYAARGAIELAPEGAVVIDAGTAATVDAVRPEDGRPHFLGGAIAPGPALLSAALARGGAKLHAVAPEGPVPALGRDTRAALESGVVHGFRGAMAELARRVGLEAGLAAAPRLLCGGAAPLLLEPEPFWPGELVHRPDLVHRGLLIALDRHLGPGAASSEA
jgi:type III pantothenate kinase